MCILDVKCSLRSVITLCGIVCEKTGPKNNTVEDLGFQIPINEASGTTTISVCTIVRKRAILERERSAMTMTAEPAARAPRSTSWIREGIEHSQTPDLNCIQAFK